MEEVQRKEALELEETEATTWSRRDFLSLAGWGGVLAFLSTVTVAFLRFMFPRVLFEPNPVFRAGRPEAYQPGAVDERFKQAQRIWIERNEDGSLFAMLAIYTHLGCTPNWLKGEQKFKCPCHGSGFKPDGTNFEGPAPRPLDRVRSHWPPMGSWWWTRVSSTGWPQGWTRMSSTPRASSRCKGRRCWQNGDGFSLRSACSSWASP